LAAESQQVTYPYFVKIETSTGRSATISVAFLTAKQIENLFQSDFKRLAQEAGMAGARIHVEPAVTADYDTVLRDMALCLRTGTMRVA
jgi:hypothetical protein